MAHKIQNPQVHAKNPRMSHGLHYDSPGGFIFAISQGAPSSSFNMPSLIEVWRLSHSTPPGLGLQPLWPVGHERCTVPGDYDVCVTYQA